MAPPETDQPQSASSQTILTTSRTPPDPIRLRNNLPARSVEDSTVRAARREEDDVPLPARPALSCDAPPRSWTLDSNLGVIAHLLSLPREQSGRGSNVRSSPAPISTGLKGAPASHPNTSAYSLMKVMALRTSIMTVTPSSKDGVLLVDDRIDERNLRALIMKALTWLLERECLSVQNTYVVFVGDDPHGPPQDMSKCPALPASVIWDLANELVMDAFYSSEEFDDFMFHSGKFIPRGYGSSRYARLWALFAMIVIDIWIYTGFLNPRGDGTTPRLAFFPGKISTIASQLWTMFALLSSPCEKLEVLPLSSLDCNDTRNFANSCLWPLVRSFSVTTEVLSLPDEKCCKIQGIIFSVRSVLDGVRRDEGIVHGLLEEWWDCVDYLERASGHMQVALQSFRQRAPQDENIVSARATLDQLKALWDARLQVMRANLDEAARVAHTLQTGARVEVPRARLDTLLEPLKHISEALRSQQEVQAQYLADLTHILVFGTKSPQYLPADHHGAQVSVERLRTACFKFEEMRDLINDMRRLNSVQQNLDELRVELTSAE
ncbi:hypothetical protein C8Q76DRAFT_796002 [Earliella scabrosa]|nr:hypothetical protein C8Q76DRAFT_796002 [Earliella scabrosa]